MAQMMEQCLWHLSRSWAFPSPEAKTPLQETCGQSPGTALSTKAAWAGEEMKAVVGTEDTKLCHKGQLAQLPCTQQAHLELHQSPVQSDLECSQGCLEGSR